MRRWAALGLLLAACWAAAADRTVIELPQALFATGDDPARARPDFDDSRWVMLSTLANYEKQGFPDYDGYSWYRFHVTIPASLKGSVHWPQRLHLYLSSIDDVDETFLNGVKIGSMGQMPEDPRGYATRWNGLRWTWGSKVQGSLWRTTGDIEDGWRAVKEIMDAQAPLAAYARPGQWNDPDMLVVGDVGWGGELHPSRLTPDEQYSHVSLWALLAAPLLLGNDLTHLDAFTRNLVLNDEVIDIDQDPLGHAAQRVWAADDWEIWVRDLADGRHAVGVFNFGGEFRRLELMARVPALAAGAPVRDVWRQRVLPPVAANFEARLPAHGVWLLVTGGVFR